MTWKSHCHFTVIFTKYRKTDTVSHSLLQLHTANVPELHCIRPKLCGQNASLKLTLDLVTAFCVHMGNTIGALVRCSKLLVWPREKANREEHFKT